jgi:hypothetical protein
MGHLDAQSGYFGRFLYHSGKFLLAGIGKYESLTISGKQFVKII